MRIVMLLHKTVEHDARVRREGRALSEAGHQVVVVHLPRGGEAAPGAEADSYELRSAAPGALAGRLPGGPRRAISVARIARIAASERPDFVHAHDAAMLVPGWMAARAAGAPMVYDSHELATGVAYHSRSWSALVRSVERLFVPRCEAVITVSDGIARRLRDAYGLERLPTVVRNVPDLPPPRPGAVEDLRRSLGVGAAPLVLHHGAVAAGRGGEVLIRSIGRLEAEDARLLFLGAEGEYAARLRALSAELGLQARVYFRDPVPLGDLLSYTAQADVGVSLLQDTCENHRLALPNKAFEYIAAGIPLVAGDLPELRRLVESHGVGWLVDPTDPESVAAGLRSSFAARGDEALHDRLVLAAGELCWEREREQLTGLYRRLGASRSA